MKYFHQTGDIASVCSLEFPQGATDCVTSGQTLLEDEVIDVKQVLIREHEGMLSYMACIFAPTSSGPPSEPEKKVMHIVAPAGATGHAFQSGQPIEAICLRYSACVSIAEPQFFKEVTHHSTSLHAVKVLLRLIRAILV